MKKEKITINIDNVMQNVKLFLQLSLPFILMEAVTYGHGHNIKFPPKIYNYISPILFDISYLILFIGIIMLSKGKWRKILYCANFSIFFLIFLVNNVYYSKTSFYFSFNLLNMASEGSSYIWDVVINANPFIYIISIFILLLYLLYCIKKISKVPFSIRGGAWFGGIIFRLAYCSTYISWTCE